MRRKHRSAAFQAIFDLCWSRFNGQRELSCCFDFTLPRLIPANGIRRTRQARALVAPAVAICVAAAAAYEKARAAEAARAAITMRKTNLCRVKLIQLAAQHLQHGGEIAAAVPDPVEQGVKRLRLCAQRR